MNDFWTTVINILSTWAFIILSWLLFGLIIMLLWNWLMPELFNFPVINYGQAVGLNVLINVVKSKPIKINKK